MNPNDFYDWLLGGVFKTPILPVELIDESVDRVWKDRPGCEIGVWVNCVMSVQTIVTSRHGFHRVMHDPGLEHGVVMVGPVVRSDAQYLEPWPGDEEFDAKS